MKAVVKSAKPYADDALNLPVNDVESAIPAIKVHRANGRDYRAFFVVAPDGLCYLVAQPVD